MYLSTNYPALKMLLVKETKKLRENKSHRTLFNLSARGQDSN
jgi:hypothetical protein